LKKIQNIQALRGIAVLSVVFFHLLMIERKYGGSKTILPDFFQFGMFGVDLFFVISGFVMFTVSRGRFQIPKHALRFIYHRVARIYPTYWVYSILVLIVFLLKPTWVNNSQGNQVNILSSFLLLPSETLPLVMVGWTLIHEMYFYLIFFIIFLLISERQLFYAIFLWGICVVLLNLSLESSTPALALISHPLTFEFMGGCILASIYYKKEIKIKNSILLILASLSLLSAIYGYLYYNRVTGQIAPLGWWRIVIFGIPALFMVSCITSAERNGFIMHTSLILIGDASFSLYLSHGLTMSVIGRMWSAFPSDNVLVNIIMMPILIILVLIVGFISYRVVELPLLRLTRKIA
jgi:exopolysaccharide production protein ExoZ